MYNPDNTNFDSTAAFERSIELVQNPVNRNDFILIIGDFNRREIVWSLSTANVAEPLNERAKDRGFYNRLNTLMWAISAECQAHL